MIIKRKHFFLLVNCNLYNCILNSCVTPLPFMASASDLYFKRRNLKSLVGGEENHNPLLNFEQKLVSVLCVRFVLLLFSFASPFLYSIHQSPCGETVSTYQYKSDNSVKYLCFVCIRSCFHYFVCAPPPFLVKILLNFALSHSL